MAIPPKPKGNELIDRFNALDAAGRQNEFVMAALKRDARALRTSDAGMSFQVEGLLEFATGDPAKGRQLMERAIALEPNRYVFRSNYAASLLSYFYIRDAWLQQEHAYRLSEGSPDDARDLCRFALFAGRITRAAEVLKLLRRMKAELDESIAKTVEDAKKVQDARSFSDDQATEFLDHVYDFFSSRQEDLSGFAVGAVPDEENGLLTLDLQVRGSGDDLWELQQQLTEYRLDLNEPLDLACAYAINLRAASDDSHPR